MELTEYRQITGGIGVALFVAGMAIWPAGVTAKPWNWTLWGVGVVIAVLGIYVFTAGVAPSLWLPVKATVFERVKTRNRIDQVLGAMRARVMDLDPNDDDGTKDWCKDVIELITKAFGGKHTALFVPAFHLPKEKVFTLGEYLGQLIVSFDAFLVRSDSLPIRSDFVFDTNRWMLYLTYFTAGSVERRGAEYAE